MKNSMMMFIFCTSFFSSTFTAERSQGSPLVDEFPRTPKPERITVSKLPRKRTLSRENTYRSPRPDESKDQLKPRQKPQLAPELSKPPVNQ